MELHSPANVVEAEDKSDSQTTSALINNIKRHRSAVYLHAIQAAAVKGRHRVGDIAAQSGQTASDVDSQQTQRHIQHQQQQQPAAAAHCCM